jgi:hypothetical protein
MFKEFVTSLGAVFPDLIFMEHTEQSPIWHPEGDVLKHTFGTLQQLRFRTDATVWAAFLHDIGKIYTTKLIGDRITAHGHDKEGTILAEAMLDKLKVSNKHKKEVLFVVENHMKIKNLPKMKRKKVLKLMKHEYFEALMEVSVADDMSSVGWTDWYFWAREFEKSPSFPKGEKIVPLVSGADLIALEKQPGPEFKILLSKLLDMQLENPDMTKEDLLDTVKDIECKQ